ncbi:MAG: S24 family peptidase [Pseudomonadota bacterium]
MMSKRGGKRVGAGRPKGSGRFKEETKAIRVPVGSLIAIDTYLQNYKAQPTNHLSNQETSAEHIGNITTVLPFKSVSKLALPLQSSRVAAGYPTSAEEHIEDTLDLNQYMVDRPESTYMLQVEGESMRDIGILPNDILVVDRSLQATHNKIVIAAVDGELTVKRLYHRGGLIRLLPENRDFPAIEIAEENDLVIWGVVIGSFRRFQTL